MNWFQKRAARRAEARRDAGFGFIMTRYYRHKEPASYLYECVIEGRAWDPDPFDQGAMEALELLPQQDRDDPNFYPGCS